MIINPVSKSRWILPAVIGVILMILPLLWKALAARFLIRLMGIAGLYMLLALGLNLVIGFVGLLDLGFMAFYAIGAYTSALLAIHKVPFIWCVLASMALAMIIRVVIGFPALRLRGDYLAIVSYRKTHPLPHTSLKWESLHGRGVKSQISR